MKRRPLLHATRRTLHHMPIVVIGEDVQKRLLPNQDPIGKRIEVDGHELEVIGVMDRPAASLPGPGRYAHPDAVLHDAQDVPERAGAYADRDRLSRA